ncbi:MAG: hypothetical protein ACOX9E_08110 [Lentisphaeria bacterium]|jgi:hypothetical protein
MNILLVTRITQSSSSLHPIPGRAVTTTDENRLGYFSPQCPPRIAKKASFGIRIGKRSLVDNRRFLSADYADLRRFFLRVGSLVQEGRCVCVFLSPLWFSALKAQNIPAQGKALKARAALGGASLRNCTLQGCDIVNTKDGFHRKATENSQLSIGDRLLRIVIAHSLTTMFLRAAKRWTIWT